MQRSDIAYSHLLFKMNNPPAKWHSLGLMTIEEVNQTIAGNIYPTEDIEEVTYRLSKMDLVEIYYMFKCPHCKSQNMALEESYPDVPVFLELSSEGTGCAGCRRKLTLPSDFNRVEKKFAISNRVLEKMNVKEDVSEVNGGWQRFKRLLSGGLNKP
jgi:hypothetical protein